MIKVELNNNMKTFYIWTIGCQMNKADSDNLGSALEQMGLVQVSEAALADVVVLNSCVVRQSAEDKVTGRLRAMKLVKQNKPESVLALMGCMVGPKSDQLQEQFPYVDFFMRPQRFEPLLAEIGDRIGVDWQGCVRNLVVSKPSISAYVPIIHGCDLMCTFCIIPYRRGRQVSRTVQDILSEVKLLVQRGIKEVTVLGQTVDAYGYDLPDKPNLAVLLEELNVVDGLDRIRFLTSHPNFMTDDIIDVVRNAEKVCEHINLPIQSGDNDMLKIMRRRYTLNDYTTLIHKIRDKIPDVAISTDIIVGFCDESKKQFENTVELIQNIKFDKVHVSAYSTREGTIASRKMIDNVSTDEKKLRKKIIDEVQRDIQLDKNQKFIGEYLEVLVDGRERGKWKGRTRSDKLVFFEDSRDVLGKFVKIQITKTSPWSLQGALV